MTKPSNSPDYSYLTPRRAVVFDPSRVEQHLLSEENHTLESILNNCSHLDIEVKGIFSQDLISQKYDLILHDKIKYNNSNGPKNNTTGLQGLYERRQKLFSYNPWFQITHIFGSNKSTISKIPPLVIVSSNRIKDIVAKLQQEDHPLLYDPAHGHGRNLFFFVHSSDYHKYLSVLESKCEYFKKHYKESATNIFLVGWYYPFNVVPTCIGFGALRNAVLTYFFEKQYEDYFWMLDDDVCITPTFKLSPSAPEVRKISNNFAIAAGTGANVKFILQDFAMNGGTGAKSHCELVDFKTEWKRLEAGKEKGRKEESDFPALLDKGKIGTKDYKNILAQQAVFFKRRAKYNKYNPIFISSKEDVFFSNENQESIGRLQHTIMKIQLASDQENSIVSNLLDEMHVYLYKYERKLKVKVKTPGYEGCQNLGDLAEAIRINITNEIYSIEKISSLIIESIFCSYLAWKSLSNTSN